MQTIASTDNVVLTEKRGLKACTAQKSDVKLFLILESVRDVRVQLFLVGSLLPVEEESREVRIARLSRSSRKGTAMPREIFLPRTPGLINPQFPILPG
ncbi:hypothetical protein I302_104935 [Kwoniella bestiolae CBS 10118]|uniref:Uncharacterized protein n=1 Tax=Kwoniella bestiolae CBS 10118 TaxID=1296100 RepID=A0AAJ8K808_9TREE